MTTGDQDPFDPQRSYPPPPAADYLPPQPGYGPSVQPGYPPVPSPYDAPGGYYPTTPPGAVGHPGGLWIRLAARLLDSVGAAVVGWLLSFFVDDDSRWLATGVFSGFLIFVYFVVFEATKGRTPGKALVDLRVHGPGGVDKPTWKEAAIRNAFTLVGLIPCAGWFLAPMAYIWIAFTIESSPTKQGKHDQLAGGTQVVKT